uniref:Ion transport domain-containing protein n=1 Tax=Anguilla anguilla TaxID=7936 RepID=A0A0E9QJ44_ANGAN
MYTNVMFPEAVHTNRLFFIAYIFYSVFISVFTIIEQLVQRCYASRDRMCEHDSIILFLLYFGLELFPMVHAVRDQ